LFARKLSITEMTVHHVSWAILSDMFAKSLSFFSKIIAILAWTTFFFLMLFNIVEFSNYITTIWLVLTSYFSFAKEFWDSLAIGARNEFGVATLTLRTIPFALVPVYNAIFAVQCCLTLITIARLAWRKQQFIANEAVEACRF